MTDGELVAEFNTDAKFEEWVNSLSNGDSCGDSWNCPVDMYFRSHGIFVRAIGNYIHFPKGGWVRLSYVISAMPGVVDRHIMEHHKGATWGVIKPATLKKMWERTKAERESICGLRTLIEP